MIRQASMKDYKMCDILDLAMAEFSEHFFNTNIHEEKIKKFYSFFGNKNTRFSLNNMYVYELENNIVAALCMYGGDTYNDTALIQYLKDSNSNFIIEKECEDDEFYIDSIAIKDEFRGKGILKELLIFAEEKAKKLGYKKLTLISKTPQYFKSFGFNEINECEFVGFKYTKMLKNI